MRSYKKTYFATKLHAYSEMVFKLKEREEKSSRWKVLRKIKAMRTP
jgi:hypothetical protein